MKLTLLCALCSVCFSSEDTDIEVLEVVKTLQHLAEDRLGPVSQKTVRDLCKSAATLHQAQRHSDKQPIEPTAEKFLQYNDWCRKHFNLQSDVSIRQSSENMGYGLFADKDLKGRQIIAETRFNQTLNGPAAVVEFDCLEFYPRLALPETLKLLQLEINGGGFFQPWMEILPRKPVHPFYFSSHQWIRLRDSHTFTNVFNQYRILLLEYTQLFEALRSDPGCAAQVGLPLRRVTLNAFRWAVTMVQSRGSEAQSDADESAVLIPCRDSINHNFYSANVVHQYEHGLSKIHLLLPTKRDHELLEHYDYPIVQWRALAFYGFSECTVHPLRLRHLDDERRKYLDKSTYDESTGIPLHRPPHEADEDMIGADDFNLLHKLANFDSVAKKKSKAVTWKFVADQLLLFIEEYPKKLGDYEVELASLNDDLERLPVQQLVCELELLHVLHKECLEKAADFPDREL